MCCDTLWSIGSDNVVHHISDVCEPLLSFRYSKGDIPMCLLKYLPRYDALSKQYRSAISVTVRLVVVRSAFISIMICRSISSFGDTWKIRAVTLDR